ncbi:unnamed protein product [Clonostachys rosea f. rosea IK726]|uniref:Uncharacterized protein n=1 Tax=Clonostachys rosea f. rosea IK726 TaxID=1349383 RepID=A0ACA9US60_BIOOC|nr:unnamed protein product [Clonostachys rosea f. rosea IK726]
MIEGRRSRSSRDAEPQTRTGYRDLIAKDKGNKKSAIIIEIGSWKGELRSEMTRTLPYDAEY